MRRTLGILHDCPPLFAVERSLAIGDLSKAPARGLELSSIGVLCRSNLGIDRNQGASLNAI
jgi:hypothetical protein